jgi:hypothetical protein
MTSVTIVKDPELKGKRCAFVLGEDRLGHYEEFRTFFSKVFELEKVGLSQPGYVRAPSGTIYALVFIGRSGESFPSGLEVYAVVDALEPLDDPAVDRDIWAILGWMIDGIGGPWAREDLERTGRLYRIPACAS